MSRKSRKKELVTGGNPDALFVLPSKDDWADVDFMLAKSLGNIGEALIASRNELKHLENAELIYMFKRKGPSAPRMKLGTCQRVSGLLAIFSNCDFIITLMANNCVNLTCWQIEAIVYHELTHAGIGPNGEWATRPHDCECFAAEIDRYGLWKSDLARIAKSSEQAIQLPFDMPLDEAIAAAGGERVIECDGTIIAPTAEELAQIAAAGAN